MSRTVYLVIALFVLHGLRASVAVARGSEPASALEKASSTLRADSPALSIHLRNGLVSVEVTEGSWEKLLQEFSRKSGIVFRLSIPLEGTVTASFKGLPVERALHELFGRDANLMLVYRSREPTVVSLGWPSEVWILGSSRQGISEAFGPQATDRDSEAFGPQDTDGDSAAAALETPDDPVQEIVRKFERDPGAARELAQGHPDPRVQRVAITYLGEQATPEALEALFVLLQDRESSVRQNALEALGPLVQHHRPVRENLVRILERSEDGDTRQLIADSLGVSLDNITPGQPIAMDVLDFPDVPDVPDVLDDAAN